MSTGYSNMPNMGSNQADPTQISSFRNYVARLSDINTKDEHKLKATQELSEHLEIILQTCSYSAFLEHTMNIFINILQDGEPQFISENTMQHVRKLTLEMIHRLPATDILRPYVKPIVATMLKLLRTDNEENALICLRIIIEYHKQFRPAFNSEIHNFLTFVKEVYNELPNHLSKIFEQYPPIRVKDLKEIDIENILPETYTIRTILLEKVIDSSTSTSQFNLLPRGAVSLKVLQELPIIVVLMYQIYKTFVHQEVAEFVPLIMATISLQPSQAQRLTSNFNKEVYVDFMSAQIKTLSFLAYIIRFFQDVIVNHAPAVVKGILSLLQSCPKEVASLRKELLVASRHILATDLRIHFIPSIDRLIDEDLVLGRGWTTYESLRPLAYSTLADLVHHVRTQLSFPILEKAIDLFAKNIHDDSLPINIQTLSCKLLLNLVACIQQHSTIDVVKARDLLVRMLKVFTLKFQTIAKIQLPLIVQKWKSTKSELVAGTAGVTTVNGSTSATTQISISSDTSKDAITLDGVCVDPQSKLISIGFTAPNSLNVTEFRSLVKTLVGGVKTITWGLEACKSGHETKILFYSHEVLIFIDLVYWALEALDIYTINAPNAAPNSGQIIKLSSQIPRSKEEKDVLEHFSGVFLHMNNQNFQEIFASTIDFMVERMYKNSALQVIANSFLADKITSPLFATILVEYLLNRMEEMGSNLERSNLYLRLFKLVFGSVSLFPAANEHMLKPHLHNIVNRSMQLAMTAKEPYNYFLLLRALFRSIGGGSHDLLYQEFLPLLPNLLERLNRLQSGLHKQHMKDLFVELCLTVPVRLSSLLPYLPMLMDPLVSALNGSHTLVNQGLRTLELCVDNLQPDFLYEHIQPVRADLMQALWRTLRNQDSTSQVAFRVLGKFGGGNRKMMIEPQRLEYKSKDTQPPAVIIFFEDNKPISFSVDKIIETAFNALKSNTTDPFYRRQSWEVIRCFLAASICLDDNKNSLQKLFMHQSFIEGNISSIPVAHYKSHDVQARQTYQTALTGMIVAAATKELREVVFPIMVAVVRHCTMIAIAQQAGPFPQKRYNPNNGLDPLVLIDALAVCMGHEEKELCKPGQLCIGLILETATTIMGNKERACRLPLMQYLAERMAALCYERPWYAKMGGCKALKCLYQHMAMRWLYQHLFVFLKAFMFVIMDLEGEVSSGAVDMAKTYLEKMLRICMIPLDKDCGNDELIATQNKAMGEVVHELVRQVTSPNTLVREQAMSLLRLISELQYKTVTDVMYPYREVLVDIIPPRKHLFRHQPARAQIGLMDGNTFCTTLEPRLFTLDLSKDYHEVFFKNLITLSDAEDTDLAKYDCYKNVTNLIPLRKSALCALAACYYINDIERRKKIQEILFKNLDRNNSELQETAFECMKKIIMLYTLDDETILSYIRPVLADLGDYRSLTLHGTKTISYLTKLFPSIFRESLCEQLLQHIQKMLEKSITDNKGQNFLSVAKTGDMEQKITILIGIFHQIHAVTAKFVDGLCQLVLQTEKTLMIESSSPYRQPLVKFLLRYPSETVNLFLNDSNIVNPQWNRFLIYLLKHSDGQPFRSVIQNNETSRLLQLMHCNLEQMGIFANEQQCYKAQHQAILITHILVELDEQWLAAQNEIVTAFKLLWQNNLYTSCENNVICDLWHFVAKILLFYFSHNTNEIELLFQLLRALCMRFIPDFHFLKDFLQNTVAQSYTVDWKRKAFFYFVENFNNPIIPEELKAKILTAVLIPCFAVSFDKGEGNKLIGTPPAPYQEDTNNVVSVFITKVIDPDKPFANDDAVRIALLQFSCLLVERASPHIHDGDANNKRHSNKLRRLMTFAWPCLLSKNCVDPTARYHGHLLLSHIIARLPINKKIVLQVFHSLLKGHAIEARPVVRQALEMLTPAMPLRMEDCNTMLTHWTKKIIVEEGHSIQQLFHILQLVVRHYKVYYPVRHHLVPHMINYMQRLGFPSTVALDFRKLAVEIAEVIIKWEIQRMKEESSDTFPDDDGVVDELKLNSSGSIKRPASEDLNEMRKKLTAGESYSQQSQIASTSINANIKQEGSSRPIDRTHCDAVFNFLMRLACQVNDAQTNIGVVSPGEALSRRCLGLLKNSMKPDVWPQPFDLKLGWMDKLFSSLETQQANFGNICTALEILAFLLTVFKKDEILSTFRTLQHGLSLCVTCSNTRVIRLMHAFLSRLINIFPIDTQINHEELETLYSVVNKMIIDGLATYEKTPQSNPSSLFGTLMILKACCSNNQSYIDKLMIPFMRLLHRLKTDHLNGTMGTTIAGQSEGGTLGLELLILCLDLMKNRIGVMHTDVRKVFIGRILVGLIEKTTDSKIMKSIVRIIEDWIKTNNTQTAVTVAGPTLREKSFLLVKLMQYIEKHFSDDQDLNAQFLELINYIYRNDVLKHTELTAKLESAFLSGLKSTQPQIRAKFFEVLNGSMRKLLYDRFLYIVTSQSWDSIGSHYWIKQCIELLLLSANTANPIQNANQVHLLPSITSVINNADNDERKLFTIEGTPLSEAIGNFETIEDKEDVFDMDISIDSNISRQEDSERPVTNRTVTLTKLITQQFEYLEASRKIRTEEFLTAASQLCHMDTQLAERMWINLFPKLWNILDQNQQLSIENEIIQFLTSGIHVIQEDCNPSAINTFVEAICQCQPPILIPPSVMTYLGKAHNLWHRMTLLLEERVLDCRDEENYEDDYELDSCDYNIPDNRQSSIFDPLSQMYNSLHEEDMWAGLWLKYAKYPETNTAIAYEQMGFFEEAQCAYDIAMTKYKQDAGNNLIRVDMSSELLLWENHWIRCAKELNQWDILLNYAQSSAEKKCFLIMECAWRVPDWTLMKQAFLKVEQTSPKQNGYKVNLYKGYLAILHPQERQSVERYVEMSSTLCLREWRRLPLVVSHIHLPILQAAQQIMELQEACQIHQGLVQCRSSSIHDMTAIVKTWRNRLPVIADDLSHWSDIFTWRQHQFQIITSHLERQADSGNHRTLGVHASAEAIIHFGKIARKHNLTGVCQESLSRIYTIPSVPIVDCYQKIRQQVKCYLQMAAVSGRVELNEALEVIKSTNLIYFTPEMVAEFYAMKGLLLAQTGKSSEANEAFTTAIQSHENLTKAWALWGEYFEHIFTRETRYIHLGVNAIICFLHACRHQNESKTRKYLAKVLWLLSYDDKKSSLMNALEKYSVRVPPVHWLPWIPQLLCCLVLYETTVIMNLLSQVGRMFPQAVYFPIRTLYLTLKIEQRTEQVYLASKKQAAQQQTSDGQINQTAGTSVNNDSQQTQPQLQQSTSTGPAIRATPSMWRCSRVMHIQREIHPTILSSLEGIVDQIVWFRGNWYEEVLRQLRQGLIKCYAIAFENRNSVSDATITPHTLNFVKKLVSTFGIGIENISNSIVTSESMARRTQSTIQDPVSQKMKGQFTRDFDFTQPGSTKLHNLIYKLKDWIKILEANTEQLPKSFLIEDKCRFLSNFSEKTAEVALPGELLLPGPSHYHIRIAKFMPRVEIVQKHNTAARRLYIRGTNGKIYPYLVVSDSGVGDARREEPVLQLMRMLNHYLAKQKETSRRFLHITVPRVVSVSPHMRLVEDNPASISLLDIYKSGCMKLGIEHDAPIARYYEKLAEVQARNSQATHAVLRDILYEVQTTMVPKTLIKNWALRNFRSATDYWQFRKMFTLQLSLAYLCEYAFHLTRINIDMMYVHQDSGLLNISYFKFDVDDATGELDVIRPVPFRLTPNIAEFLSTIGISGPLTSSMIAAARCLLQPSFKLPSILQAILRDEIITVYKKRIKEEKSIIDSNSEMSQLPMPEFDMEKIINVVNKAVGAIMQRLNNMAYVDSVDLNKISTTIQAAMNPDNLCRMDPAWHPWL